MRRRVLRRIAAVFALLCAVFGASGTAEAAPGALSLTLTVECSGTTSQIRLNWTTASGATSYDMYRNGAVYTTGLTGTQFINTAVASGSTYSYSILARNTSGSTSSSTQSGTAANCAAPGTAALTLTAECSGTTSQIRLNWTAASGATSYDMYRNGAVYTTGLTGTQFINTAVTAPERPRSQTARCGVSAGPHP